ncbi:bifunctional adenosylcobinamide kinase/adenosylcobinamide-phosphate guanylyltransferase [Cytobacillus oceanisediminis]|uniref:bifunctional adenosylcobinamide kinase/adenosylcobinamide-phosphate guanylyltransferase n=1 Tax=Cytobacillus oceanisediminis TaxID=665099 RepID=UPI00204219E6|nr:bifunctional adenosylcobinamide kinase/adenosylcobinamide-phosphate guanylyltransferase [Cytobacillus oceanisediminis]MCM3405098.1 bifunctional adenosylcobinamide kinase/adenosylcobinamide-phosphate guanylyltransferase [Cytobacillus oceanisediminis]MDK7668591.1 bifunctional adenosylcobinamide kinase/adenosylcobinamide-phosphate guanylyltransferase [Cytobacillus oceanisediminis]
MAEGSLIFISGGVRSGKSSFAERTAAGLAIKTEGKLHYIAAGKAYDPEMKVRIQRHQDDREKSGLSWTTWEKPSALEEISGNFNNQDIILFDCLTTLLNNELFRAEDVWRNREFQENLSSDILRAITEIRKKCRALIVVSNEVLNEPIGKNELVITYSKILGTLHRNLVNMADEAYLVEAGIPIQMKGEPE